MSETEINKIETDPAPPFIDPLTAEAKFKVEVTEEEKEQFFKAFLADKPFEYTAKLFGDKLSVKFTTLTVEQNNDIFRQIVLDQEKGIAKNHDSYFIRISLFRLGLSLVEINGMPFSADITKSNFNIEDKGITYVRAKSDTFDAWPVYKLGAVMDAFRTFEAKVNELTKASLDPSFWKAAA